MRVIAGRAKGIKILSVKGKEVRPTSDRVKEAIFSIISSELKGTRCLDLYAGTGALGIEALSRGSEYCCFVDNSNQAIKVIKRNLERTNFIEKSLVLRKKVEDFIKKTPEDELLYNLIFLDPPYKINTSLLGKLIYKLVVSGYVLPEGQIVVEHAHDVELNKKAGSFVKTDLRRYGDTSISIYQIEETL